MSTRHLVDPTLLPALDAFPPLALGDAMLPALRESMNAMVAASLPPLPDDVTAERRTIPGGDGQAMDVLVYRPRGTTGPAPGLLHIHGGGFVFGSPEMGQPLNAALAAAIGGMVVSVDYRLAPETRFPGPLNDCAAALRWMLAEPSLGVDPARVGVRGDSAGAGLAFTLALRARSAGGPPIRHLCLNGPMLDDRTGLGDVNPHTGEFVWTAADNRYAWGALLGDLSEGAVPEEAAGARARDLSRLPATFICTGALDLFVEEDMALAARLLRAGVPTELHVYPGAFHGFEVAGDVPLVRTLMRDITASIVAALGSGPA